jgi:hypothetical protein
MACLIIGSKIRQLVRKYILSYGVTSRDLLHSFQKMFKGIHISRLEYSVNL